MKLSGQQRAERIQTAFRDHNLDALVCALPRNVLMMSGYWPVVGTGVAVALRGGPIVLLIPEDETDIAASGWADEVHTFEPGSLDSLQTVADAIQKPLAELAKGRGKRIGYEAGESSEPASYAAMHIYSGRMGSLLGACFRGATVIPADQALIELRARKTTPEIELIRTACEMAGDTFTEVDKSIVRGNNEIDISNLARNGFSAGLARFPGVQRADGFAWCMSGPNSALASAAYARSRRREIENGDLVLVHCNSYADGYWTDITRTWCAGEPDDRAKEIFEAVFAARESALGAIRPGVRAAAIDEAARSTMQRYGFAAAFRHSTGHGVGFGAINAEARPRLQPASPDILEPGMVFNVEPAAYFDGYGGVRHCDVVVVTERGCDVLTPFLCNKERALKGS